MHKCKTCSFWKENEEWSDDRIIHPYDPDTYEEMKMPFQVKICKADNITYFERNPKSNGISLCDASNYRADMYTGEDFGCVLHSSCKKG